MVAAASEVTTQMSTNAEPSLKRSTGRQNQSRSGESLLGEADGVCVSRDRAWRRRSERLIYKVSDELDLCKRAYA